MTHLNQVIRSTFDLRDYSIKATENLPAAFELENLPTVKNQGSKPTCVAHACASIIEYMYKQRNNKVRKFSTQFIYGLRDVGYYVGDGMMVRNALKTLHTYGVPFYTTCPGNDDIDAAMDIVSDNLPTYLPESLQYTVDGYFRCKTEAEIKTALITYGPVIMAMNYNSNAKIKDDIYIDTETFNGGGHCMFIYGWNEDGWLIQNSWGASFAQDGRFILPYAQKIKESWGIIPANSAAENIVKPNTFKLLIYKIYNKLANWVLDKLDN